jgi:hypothetical protein
MGTRLSAIIVLISAATLFIIVYLYSYNLALGQQETNSNRSSSITLSPIHASDDIIKKSFQKELDEIVTDIGYDE